MVVESWGIGRADFSNVTTVSGILGISGEVHVVSGEIALQSGVFVSGTFILVESGIYFASGLGVLVSGQMVSVASGLYVVADIAESGMGVNVQSGYGVIINSGVGVTIQSGAGVLISGQMIQVASGAEIIWRGIQVSGLIAVLSGEIHIMSGSITATISGQPVTISGDHVFVESGVYLASGMYVVADIAESGMGVTIQSGAGVQVQSGVEIIWRGVQVSGAIAISGSVTMISGIIDIKTPTDILIAAPNNPQVIGAISGGIPLTSGAIISVIIKALTINSGDIYAGGYKTGHRPYSGVGFLLEPGDAMSINIDDIGKINVFAAISGDQVTYMGNA